MLIRASTRHAVLIQPILGLLKVAPIVVVVGVRDFLLTGSLINFAEKGHPLSVKLVLDVQLVLDVGDVR